MYSPSKIEKQLCYSIVRELMNGDNKDDYDKIVDEIFSITYSIGGDYEERTLREVAKIVISSIE